MDNNKEDIAIEERSADEVVKIGEKRIAPVGVRIFNLLFDVTPPGANCRNNHGEGCVFIHHMN